MALTKVPRIMTSAVVQSKTTTYTALVTDDLINCSAAGGAFAVTLYAASGNSGKILTITKTDSSVNAVTIDGSGSETINGALTTLLYTQYESVTIYCDGSNWFQLDRRIPSQWVSWTPTGSWSTNTTYTGKKRRVGDNMEYRVRVSTSGAPTSAALTITIAETIDTSKLLSTTFDEILGSVKVNDSTTAVYFGDVRYNSTTVVSLINWGAASSIVNQPTAVDQANPITFGAGDFVEAFFSVPISGWEG